MDKKELLRIVIKVLIYALTLIGAWLGVTSLSACSYNRSVTSTGRAVVVTTAVDTTYIDHGGTLEIKTK